MKFLSWSALKTIKEAVWTYGTDEELTAWRSWQKLEHPAPYIGDLKKNLCPYEGVVEPIPENIKNLVVWNLEAEEEHYKEQLQLSDDEDEAADLTNDFVNIISLRRWFEGIEVQEPFAPL